MNGEKIQQINKTPPKKVTTRTINGHVSPPRSPSPPIPTTNLSDSRSPPSTKSHKRRNSENINPNVPTIDINETTVVTTATTTDFTTEDAGENETTQPAVETEEAVVPPEKELETRPPTTPSPPPVQPQYVGEALGSWGIWRSPQKRNIKFEGYVQSHGNLLTEVEIRELLDTSKTIAEILKIPDDKIASPFAEENVETVEETGDNSAETEDAETGEETPEATREAEERDAQELEEYKQLKRDEWTLRMEKSFPKFVSARELLALCPAAQASFVTNNDSDVPPVMIFTEQDKKWLRKHERVAASGDGAKNVKKK